VKQPYLFVTVGSTDFDPLVQAVDCLMPTLGTPAGTMQVGHGRYLPVNLPFFRFAPSLEPYYAKASLVIAHGGLGITMEVLKRGIPLVSVSNEDRYDRHQEDLLQSMAEEGYLYWCRDVDQLAQAIADAQARPLRPYVTPECRIHLMIDEYLKMQAR
jgi:UDP-N-acetylglucosamine transferase subunit ALG13